MLVSAIFGARMNVIPSSITTSSLRLGGGSTKTAAREQGAVVIECSSRPQKKATKHHMKTRPRKTQPWDINRKPTVYPPLPSLPPDWTLLSSAADADQATPVATPTPPSLNSD